MTCESPFHWPGSRAKTQAWPSAQRRIDAGAPEARLQVEIAKNADTRARTDVESRELERCSQALRIEQHRLASEQARLQSELALLQQPVR